jgi:hypothetical protein
VFKERNNTTAQNKQMFLAVLKASSRFVSPQHGYGIGIQAE